VFEMLDLDQKMLGNVMSR